MMSRRTFVLSAAAVATGASAARAQDACAVFTADKQATVKPEDAVRLLKEGNARFVMGATVNCDLMAQVRATAKGQAPIAAIVGCIDSRVPPELVFDQRLGSIFAARIAGNFVNTDILGSLEFACKVAGAKAIVVLGHTDCGAIKGAVDQAKLGNLTAMLKNFDPAVAATKIEGERSSKNKTLVQSVADMHSKLTGAQILAQSPVLKEMVDQKQLVVVSAMHDLSTGKVEFFA
jgi:carbonic anhydrase